MEGVVDVPLKVLGDRVLVRPDVDERAPEKQGSVFVAKSLAAAVTGADAETSVCRGTVVAVGAPRHPLKEEADALALRLEQRIAWTNAERNEMPEFCAADMLRDLTRRHPCCNVGDDVLFSYDTGQRIDLDQESFIILHEHELLAIVEPEREAVHV